MDGESYSTAVVGVSFRNSAEDGGKDRQDIIERMAERGRVFVEFGREYDNRHDENAISVWMDNEKIGYLDGDLAADVAPLIDLGCDIQVTDCEIIGGTLDKPTYGVSLEFSVEC